MKKILVSIVIFTLVSAILYVIGGFINADFNSFNWELKDRALLSFFCLCFGGLAAGIYLVECND